MSGLSASILGMAVMGAFAGSGFAPASVPAVTQAVSPKRQRGIFGMFSQGSLYVGRKGAGISMAQQKRQAKKSRNVKRHKAAVRG